MPLYPPPSSGALAIGGAVTGGTAGRMLYEGAGPVLADSGAASAALILTGVSLAAAWGVAATNQDLTFGAGRMLVDARQAGELNISHAALTANGSQSLRCNSVGSSRLNSAAGQNITFSTGNSSRWQVNGSSIAFEPSTDNTNDFGGTTTRVRRAFLAEYLEISEVAAPGTPGAAKARFYLKDNAGKQNLVIKWDDGVESLIVAQP